MPRCGSQIMFCDLPVRLDTYRGCAFGCWYCFERLKRSGDRKPRPEEGLEALRRWIRGRRTTQTAWCDWDIPLHWGGISDPFQPVERRYGLSLQMLREFADTGYPFLVSTKSTMLMDSKYRDVLRCCNVVLQVSLCSPNYDVWERAAPSFRDRLLMVMRLAGLVKRVIIRIQPYTPYILRDVLRWLPVYAASGVHGVTVEGLVWHRKWGRLTEWFGGCAVYPVKVLIEDYVRIKQACHDVGLRFYCAENRLRWLGDSPTCCGCDEMHGFDVNVANINYMPIEYTARMKQRNTGAVFRSLARTAEMSRRYGRMSYRDVMESLLARRYRR